MNAILDILETFNDKKAQSSFDGNDVKNYRLLATIVYLIPVLFFLPYINGRDSEYCRFHANQSLAWLMFCLVIGIICCILGFIPVFGSIVCWILGILTLLTSIFLMIGTFNDLAVKIPVFGEIASIF